MRRRIVIVALLALATAALADSADRRAIYRAGFLRRCAVSTPAAVCECVAVEASRREEVELKRLGFALETGALQLWLADARKRCAAGEPAAPAPLAAPVSGDDRGLGLDPFCAVTSTPSGGKVFVGDEERGVTPLRTRVKAIQQNIVRVELDGFFPERLTVEPNANEETALAFTLRPASRVRVTSEPPGATVSVGGEVVLEKTPGLTGPIQPGPAQLVLTLAGHVAVQKALTLTEAEASVDATLVPGVKLAVSSTPPGADVRLDGVRVGVTPLDVYGPARGKRTVVVSKPGWSSVTRVVSNPRGTERVTVTLADVELAEALRRVAQARGASEQAGLALVRLQNEASESAEKVPAALQRRISASDKVVEEQAARLELAERALRELKKRRASP